MLASAAQIGVDAELSWARPGCHLVPPSSGVKEAEALSQLSQWLILRNTHLRCSQVRSLIWLGSSLSGTGGRAAAAATAIASAAVVSGCRLRGETHVRATPSLSTLIDELFALFLCSLEAEFEYLRDLTTISQSDSE